jgi:hypothetical protein
MVVDAALCSTQPYKLPVPTLPNSNRFLTSLVTFVNGSMYSVLATVAAPGDLRSRLHAHTIARTCTVLGKPWDPLSHHLVVTHLVCHQLHLDGGHRLPVG